MDTLGMTGTLTILSLLSTNMIFKKMVLEEGKEGRKREGEEEGERERQTDTETPTGCLLDAPRKGN